MGSAFLGGVPCVLAFTALGIDVAQRHRAPMATVNTEQGSDGLASPPSRNTHLLYRFLLASFFNVWQRKENDDTTFFSGFCWRSFFNLWQRKENDDTAIFCTVHFFYCLKIK